MLVSGPKYSEEGIDIGEVVVDTLEFVSLIVEARQSMSWAVNESKDLRAREQEVEDLGNEEEQDGLREVPKDADHCKRHSCKVAKGITDENL